MARHPSEADTERQIALIDEVFHRHNQAMRLLALSEAADRNEGRSLDKIEVTSEMLFVGGKELARYNYERSNQKKVLIAIYQAMRALEPSAAEMEREAALVKLVEETRKLGLYE